MVRADEAVSRRWLTSLPVHEPSVLRQVAVLMSTVTGLTILLAVRIGSAGEAHVPVLVALAVALLLQAGAVAGVRSCPAHLLRPLAVWPDLLVVVVLIVQAPHPGPFVVLVAPPVVLVAQYGSRLELVAAVAVVAAPLLGVAVSSTAGSQASLSRLLAAASTVAFGTVLGFAVRLVSEQADARMQRLDERARRDAVTGLLNRRGFDETLEALWEADEHRPLAVVFFDLDHFKRINDTHGHDAGDQVLKAFARVLRAGARDDEAVGRTGGEEFALALPGHDLHTAATRATELVERVADLRVPCPDDVVRLTVSAGVAQRTPHHAGPSSLCRDADRALYAAKDAGRNQAVVAPQG
jgi:diguanylate cyclase (GGDEF)-like protein